MAVRSAPEKNVVKLQLPLPTVNLLGFLASQSVLEKAFWRDREGNCSLAVLGYSKSEVIRSHEELNSVFVKARQLINELPLSAGSQCLCYFSFSDNNSSIWPAFGYGMVILPLLALVQTRKGTKLEVNLMADSSQSYQQSILKALKIIRSLNYHQTLPETQFRFQSIAYSPDLGTWTHMMNQLKQLFSSGQLEKAVLSRETKLKVDGQFSPWPILDAWQRATPQTYQFLFQGDFQGNEEVFFGCSPERLIKRSGNILSTEALAGTIIRGNNQIQDAQLERFLMNDRKNIHENRLVLDDICSKLRPLCQSLRVDESHSIVKLRAIQHLRYQISCVIKDTVYDEDLLKVLHPTPAVGGTPREDALSFIQEHEPYARGLYAGVCGVLGLQNSDFSVAIRSARFTNEALMLYSGAGIVKDSVAIDEWCELDNKIATVLKVLDRHQLCEEITSSSSLGNVASNIGENIDTAFLN